MEIVVNRNTSIYAGLLFLFVLCPFVGESATAQIPNQLAQDFVAGEAPSLEDVTQFEKDAAANPTDMRLVRKLGKAYFFRFFGAGETDAVAKAQKTLERALTLTKDDPETLAYLGSLHILRGLRIEKNDAAKQKTRIVKTKELTIRGETP